MNQVQIHSGYSHICMAWINGWLALSIAIATECFATISLKFSDGFKGAWYWTFLVVIGYVSAFAFLAFCLETIDLGIAYATWAGVGTIIAAIAGFVIFNETLNAVSYIGIGLVVVGIVLMNTAELILPSPEDARRLESVHPVSEMSELASTFDSSATLIANEDSQGSPLYGET